MPIAVECPCGKRFEVPTSFAGRKGRCKVCGRELDVPAFVPADPRPDSSAASQPVDRRPTKACPYCGETILAVATKCRYCGEAVDPAFRPNRVRLLTKRNGALGCLGFIALFVALSYIASPQPAPSHFREGNHALRPVPFREAIKNERVRTILGPGANLDTAVTGFGNTAVVKPQSGDEIFLFKSAEDFDRVFAYLAAKQIDEAQEVILDATKGKRGFPLAKGIRVIIWEEWAAQEPTWIPRTRVKVDEGRHLGETGWALPWVFQMP